MSYDIAELPLAPPFPDRGVCTLHYSGSFESYANLDKPIYVGKADALHVRLTEHAKSIDAAHNLTLSDFGCRWLSSNRFLDRFDHANPD